MGITIYFENKLILEARKHSFLILNNWSKSKFFCKKCIHFWRFAETYQAMCLKQTYFLLPHQNNPIRWPRELPAISFLKPSCMVNKVTAKWWQNIINVYLLNIFTQRVKICICIFFFLFHDLNLLLKQLIKIELYTFFLPSAVSVGFTLLNETIFFLWIHGTTTFRVLITKFNFLLSIPLVFQHFTFLNNGSSY